MKRAATRAVSAAGLALLAGCAGGPPGAGLGADVGGSLRVIVDSLAGPVDPATLPAPATVQAEPGTRFTFGVASLGAGSARTVQTVGLAPGANAQVSVDAAAQARALASAQGGANASASAEAALVAKGDAQADARSEARTRGWICQEIQFLPTRIEVHKTGGGWISLPITASGSVDLVALDATTSASLLAAANLEAGSYDKIRLWTADTRSNFESDANTYIALDAAGQAHTGVYTLPGNVLTAAATFDVAAGTQTALTMAFDARNSLHLAGNKAILFPHALDAKAAYKGGAGTP
ncbi:MAG: DUF4382 domain-containing protein [Candidatus Sericytochromatia bacterium]|nr:DUF4382 domain-containing protein [Candidatus Tanganyikabacteria bacterium]